MYICIGNLKHLSFLLFGKNAELFKTYNLFVKYLLFFVIYNWQQILFDNNNGGLFMDSKKEKAILKDAKKMDKKLQMEYIYNHIDAYYTTNTPSRAELLERYRTLAERKYRVYDILPQIYLGFVLGLVASLVYNLILNHTVTGLILGLFVCVVFVSAIFASMHIVFKINKKLFEEYELKVIQNHLDEIKKEAKLKK